MGTTSLKPKPTIYNGPLRETYKPQEPDEPRSPVSPLNSNGETWKYPPVAKNRLKGSGNLNQIPLEEIPAKTRLSRPFEQPYLIHPTTQRQVSARPTVVPMQANMKRADSHLRQQPAQAPKKKPALPPLTIPAPVHQSRRQKGPNSYQGDQAPAGRSDRRPRNQTQEVQRPTRHQGWNPLEESPRQQRTALTHHGEDRRAHGRGRDLESQNELGDKPKAPKNDAGNHGDRRWFFFILLMGVVGIVVIIVYVKKGWKKGNTNNDGNNTHIL